MCGTIESVRTKKAYISARIKFKPAMLQKPDTKEERAVPALT
jgi:hypothetical protein